MREYSDLYLTFRFLNVCVRFHYDYVIDEVIARRG